jgi:hypothetical protein
VAAVDGESDGQGKMGGAAEESPNQQDLHSFSSLLQSRPRAIRCSPHIQIEIIIGYSLWISGVSLRDQHPGESAEANMPA